MDEVTKTVNDLTTQIILINRDIKQLADNYTSLTSKLEDIKSHEKTVNALQAILDSYERRLSILEREYSEFRQFALNVQNDFTNRMQTVKDTARDQQTASAKEILDKLNELNKDIKSSFSDYDDRVRALESWRWYVLGIVFAVAFFLSGVPWKIIFTQ